MEKKIKFLILEDEENLLELYREYFSEISEFKVDYCLTADLALEKLKENPYDVFILDHVMDNLTGGQLVENLKKYGGVHHDKPIIFVTANLQWIEEIESKYENVSSFSKPVDFDLLISRIKELAN